MAGASIKGSESSLKRDFAFITICSVIFFMHLLFLIQCTYLSPKGIVVFIVLSIIIIFLEAAVLYNLQVAVIYIKCVKSMTIIHI